MRSRLASAFRVATIILVLFLFTGCFGTVTGFLAQQEIENEVARFQENIVSDDMDGYEDLMKQFTNTYVYYNESFLTAFGNLKNLWLETSAQKVLQNPESDSLYTDVEYFKDRIDEVVAIYEANDSDLEDPQVEAALNELAEEVALFTDLSFIWLQIYFLEHGEFPADDQEDSPATLEQIFEWFSQSAFLGDEFRLPKETVVILMDSDLTWDEVVLKQDGSQWLADVPFYNEEEQTSGSYLLTFTKQGGKWRISQVNMTVY